MILLSVYKAFLQAWLYTFPCFELQPPPHRKQNKGRVSAAINSEDMSSTWYTMAMAAARCSVLLYEWGATAAP